MGDCAAERGVSIHGSDKSAVDLGGPEPVHNSADVAALGTNSRIPGHGSRNLFRGLTLPCHPCKMSESVGGGTTRAP